MNSTTTDTATTAPTTTNDIESVVIDYENQKVPLKATSAELEKMLLIIQKEILPVTRKGVDDGNKVFGAAILNPNDNLSTVCIGTNTELKCPLLHGEMSLIYDWSKLIPSNERGPAAKNSIFLSTHEPCCMCISGILWSGFTKVYYFFPYTSTAAQGIPYDINTMHELWGVSTYRKQNKYLSSTCIMDLIQELPDSDEKKESLLKLQQQLIDEYDTLSNKYHAEKVFNTKNSLVLG